MKLNVAKTDSGRQASDFGWWMGVALVGLIGVYFGLAEHWIARAISGLLFAVVSLLGAQRLLQHGHRLVLVKSFSVFAVLFGGTLVASSLIG